MSIDPHPLSRWDPAEVRRLAHRVADMLADYLDGLAERPVFTAFPASEAERRATEAVPVRGLAPEAILDEFQRSIAPYPFGNGHPRFWGWVNSPPAVMGIFADALAAAMNPSVAGGNHAAVHVERQVIRWFGELVGMPEECMGILVSGGSMATLTALAAARYGNSGVDVRRDGLQSAPQPFAFYMTSEGHSCARKAVELLGFGSASIRTVPITGGFTMDVAALDASIARDCDAGVRPIAVIATAGTTNTGAIDDLAAIGEVCRCRGVWLHVDAAYGGPAILTDEYRDRIAPVTLADSVALDPHKWLFVPV